MRKRERLADKTTLESVFTETQRVSSCYAANSDVKFNLSLEQLGESDETDVEVTKKPWIQGTAFLRSQILRRHVIIPFPAAKKPRNFCAVLNLVSKRIKGRL